MSSEFYVRHVGAYEGRDPEAEKRLEAAGFERLKHKGGDHFWLPGLVFSKGDLKRAIAPCKSEKSKRDTALSWIKDHAHAGQIAVVEEMWGAGID